MNTIFFPKLSFSSRFDLSLARFGSQFLKVEPFEYKIMAFEKSVGAVVFRREGKKILYLLLKRSPVIKKSNGLKAVGDSWDLPKGKIEKGETHEETIRREIGEETGIKRIKFIPGFSTWINFFYRAKGEEKKNRKKTKKGLNIFKIVTYCLIETKTNKVKLSREHTHYKWLEYKKAYELISFNGTKKVLKKGNDFLVGNIFKNQG